MLSVQQLIFLNFEYNYGKEYLFFETFKKKFESNLLYASPINFSMK